MSGGPVSHHGAGRVPDEIERVALLHVLGEDEHTRVGELRPDLERGPQAVVCVRGGHADVDHRNVRLVRPHLTDQVVGVSGLAHDLETVLLEQPDDALPKED